MEQIVTPIKTKDITDWNGVFLDEKVLKLLISGCIVRIPCVYNTEDIEKCEDCGIKHGASCYYYEIVKIKGDIICGICLDIYKTCLEECNPKGCRTGDMLTFSYNNISEIPIQWQPKRLRKKMEQFLDPENKGYIFTGFRPKIPLI